MLLKIIYYTNKKKSSVNACKKVLNFIITNYNKISQYVNIKRFFNVLIKKDIYIFGLRHK